MAKSVTKNIKLTISYDGVNYSGWQNQPGKHTIQGELAKAIGELTGFVAKVSGASRTDAGVSALGQVANFVITSPVPMENFFKALNHRLPRDITILEASEVPLDFDAKLKRKRQTVPLQNLYRQKCQCPAKPQLLAQAGRA